MSGLIEQRGRVLDRSDLSAPVHHKEWTLRELLTIFRRRRGTVLACVAAAAVLAALYCLLATPRYLATGQIEVQRNDPGTLGLDRSVTGGPANTDSDALDTSMTLQTEAKILQSDALALQVIHDLNLEPTPDYFPPHKPGFLSHLFFWRKPLEPLNVPLAHAPNRRYAALKIFASHLKVEPVTGTRLINVSYSSRDPNSASAVVNRLIAALREYTFESRFQATEQASQWLSGQLAGLKKQTEDLQKTADQLEQGTGIYGGDPSQNLVLTRLQGLSGALEAAESNRILKQAIWQVAKQGDPDLISGLAGNAASGASPAMTNSLALLQTLRAKQAAVQAQIDQDSARYGSAYPEMAELHGELNGLDKSIQQEIARIGARAHTDYEIAQRAEDAARTAFEKQKDVATAAQDRLAAYQLAKEEADGSRDLYRNLLGKLKEAGVLDGLRATNLTIVSAGMAPPPDHPHSPNVPLCFAAALAGGLFLGCAGALVREAADNSVRSIEDLERTLGIPLAGVVPKFPQAPRLRLTRKRSHSPASGAALAAARSYALPPRGASSQVVLITSSAPGEGKSRLAASLAASLARSGSRVLLVDADLHCPSLHTLFGAEPTTGLAEALAAGAHAEAYARGPNLSVIWAGKAGADSADLLASSRFDAMVREWRSQYDFVLLDSAPVLSVPDVATLAQLCDRTLLVVRYESTTLQAARRSYQMVRRNLPGQAELDVVMNGVPANSPDYFAYYGYKNSAYQRTARHA